MRSLWERAKRLAKQLAKPLALIAVGVVGVLLVGRIAGDDGSAPAESPRPSGPPPEYLYLDTARTLAYLGQVDRGLLSSERRRVTVTESGGVRAGVAGSELNLTGQRVGEVVQDVTAGSTDRFYRLLGILEHTDDGEPWLATLDATKPNRVAERLREVEVGDFVQIEKARIFLPPYAALFPKTLYTGSYLPPPFSRPDERQSIRPTRAERRGIAEFRERVGDNPRMPFVLPIPYWSTPERRPITVVVPVRYAGLTSEPTSLAGEVTVVGKVLHMETHAEAERGWTDRETVRTFGPPLERAPQAVRELAGLYDVERGEQTDEDDVFTLTMRSVTFPPPVVVVLPTAIYQ